MIILVFYDFSQPVQGNASLAVLVIEALIFLVVAVHFIYNGFQVYRVLTATTRSGENRHAKTVRIRVCDRGDHHQHG